MSMCFWYCFATNLHPKGSLNASSLSGLSTFDSHFRVPGKSILLATRFQYGKLNRNSQII